MKAAAVSGSHGYRELCLAVRKEEKQLLELAKRQQYQRPANPPEDEITPRPQDRPQPPIRSQGGLYGRGRNTGSRRCYSRGEPGHLSWDCPSKRQDGNSRPGTDPTRAQPNARQVQIMEREQPSMSPALTSLLLSSSDSESGEGVRQIRVEDRGSQQQFADVVIEGVPARGVVDTGAEITIMGGQLLARVATVARLKKNHLKLPDKVPKSYHH